MSKARRDQRAAMKRWEKRLGMRVPKSSVYWVDQSLLPVTESDIQHAKESAIWLRSQDVKA